ncbi:MAG: PEP-CTERM sorting domain-containing protein [Acidobacteria bacterium]|nr:PEP-CTERM sorting domain-containing protein [Acidobacteriota bacterium]
MPLLKTLAALPAFAIICQAAPVFIGNPGFESAVLAIPSAQGPFSQVVPGSTFVPAAGTLDNWTVTAFSPATAAGGFAPAPVPLNWLNTKWWSGNNVGYLQTTVPGGLITLSQIVGTLADNTTYTLTARVGNRFFVGDANYSMQLLAGDAVLFSTGNSVQSNGATGADTIIFDSTAHPLIGRPLIIQFLLLGTNNAQANIPTEIFFDDVALDATPNATGGAVPEPATLGLSGAVLLGLSLWKRRSS